MPLASHRKCTKNVRKMHQACTAKRTSGYDEVTASATPVLETDEIFSSLALEAMPFTATAARYRRLCDSVKGD